MNTKEERPRLKLAHIWNYYDFHKYKYLFHVEDLPKERKEVLKSKGLDFDTVKKCCIIHHVKEDDQGFIMGIVHLFFVGYQDAYGLNRNTNRTQ